MLGAATVAGFAPFYLFPLPVLTLACLLCLWSTMVFPGQAATCGFLFGLGYFGAGVSWVYISLHEFGAMPALLAGIGTFLFCAFLALAPAAVGYIQARLCVSPALRWLLLIPALWVVLEWTRSWIFTGFPWLAIGYSQSPASPLAGYAPVLGVYGVSLTAVISAGLLAYVFTKIKSSRADASSRRDISPVEKEPVLSSSNEGRGGMFAAILIVLLWPLGYALKQIDWTSPAGEPLAVALLQGNIAQDLKWREESVASTLASYRGLALASDARLIILPESALPLLRDQVPPRYLQHLAEHARKNDGDVLIGIAERDGDDYYNSVFSFGTAPTQVYRKSHLVPFGEFIPPGFGWIVRWLQIPLSDFSRGATTQPPLDVAGQKVAVDICYEDVFGEEIIRPLPEATLLVNVSNDAWFGDSFALAQHLQIAQTRALETGRVMLRSTNTGITAAIGTDGQVIAAAPASTRAALSAKVQGYAGATPYVRWGNWLIISLCLTVIALIAITSARPLSPLKKGD